MNKTFMAKPGQVERKWLVVDASGVALGRLASRVAGILRGKHRPEYTPHVDTGDHVVVINAAKVVLTGRKAEQKMFWRHSRYPGGIRGVPYGELLDKRPAFLVERAIKGMLPKNRLGRAMYKKLKVYAGNEHPHLAQKPEPLEL